MAMNLPSYVHGASVTTLIGETIGVYFDEAAERFGERDALIVRHQGIRWNWRQLRERVDALATGLMAFGLEPGARIGIWSPNNTEWVVDSVRHRQSRVDPRQHQSGLSAGRGRIRAKQGGLCGAYYRVQVQDQRLSRHAGRADARAGCRLAGLSARNAAPRSAPDHNHRRRERTGRGALRRCLRPWRGAERDKLAALAGQLQFDDAINIQFTSGTTGFPKGATLTHHNILNNGFFIGEAMRLGPEDRLCIPVPLYHCFGMVLGNLACLTHGAAMVFPSEGFEPLATLEAVAAERCTALHGVPTMFIAEMDHPDFTKFDLSSLRTGIMAGSPCPIEVMRRAVERMHLGEITIAYGMTETSPVSFQSSTDDPIDRRVSTVGRVQPHIEVKIVDAEGHIVPRGTPGELLTRVTRSCSAIGTTRRGPAKRSTPLGWMHTGDLATIDDDGYCNIVGRIKDMVIRGGENVYPREIEEFLYRHPKIQDVQVIGVPDLRYGEELCAWVRLRDGETATAEEIRAFCQGQIAHYKIPRYVKFVDAFPMTVTGKIQKFLMREETIAELGLSAQKTA